MEQSGPSRRRFYASLGSALARLWRLRDLGPGWGIPSLWISLRCSEDGFGHAWKREGHSAKSMTADSGAKKLEDADM